MEMIPLYLLIFSFVIGFLSAASYFDIKRREVPDTLSYIFISGSLFLLLILAIYQHSISALEFLPLSVALFFGFSYLMYWLGQWGGGDVKMMLGLGILFTSMNLKSNFSFIDLFMNILIFGGFYGLLATLAYGIIKIKKLSKFLGWYDLIIVGGAVASILFVYYYFAFPLNLLLVLLVFLLFSMRYIYVIMDNLMYVFVPVNRLTEGDWLAEDVKKENKLIVQVKSTGLTKVDIEKLKEEKIDKVLIKIGLPFIPALLLGVIITILFANPIMMLFVYSL